MKGVLPWLVRWVRRPGTRDFRPASAAVVGPIKKYFFLSRTLFHFICPHHPASWVVGTIDFDTQCNSKNCLPFSEILSGSFHLWTF